MQGGTIASHTCAKAHDGVAVATYTPPSDTEPFRVTFTGSRFEVAAKITSPDVADDLVRAISALKLLLRPTDTVKRPNNSAPEQSQSPSIPFMITQDQKAKLLAEGYTEDQIRKMTPQEAQEILHVTAAYEAERN